MEEFDYGLSDKLFINPIILNVIYTPFIRNKKIIKKFYSENRKINHLKTLNLD